MNNLKDKVILITGASSGIGLATAECLAEQGASLIITARRIDQLEAIAENLREKYQINVLPLKVDVNNTEDLKQFDNLPAEFQDIYGLVNNAGLAREMTHIAEGDEADWDAMIDTNIKGLLKVTRKVLPKLKENNSGHIVNIGSTAGHIVYPGGGVYCASKHAVKAISDTLLLELMDSKVRVSCIDPGMVETDFSKVRFAGDEEKASAVYAGFDPLQARDIAEAIVFVMTRPGHVTIGEITLLATAQGDGRTVCRES